MPVPDIFSKILLLVKCVVITTWFKCIIKLIENLFKRERENHPEPLQFCESI